ncbi:NAD-dependent epimerase/dehydratase [Allomyces macrogynus ATCC 38327]|uniref:NAD-dependent epimerase/dehydratase n=1 Tax=Allomyces macrogynus (strain ATCC 38327) TaxID=578462 RepID=A0A0L0T8L7_ALLM3|nr:NAD-dependent epimerase/dehydratase [Allomyces macrogynus ATCC 38327]|eukprot:KNE70909.1 NAD-dependent epimerase/dehydratase [Allomyces macrogynus ATCC 38327]
MMHETDGAAIELDVPGIRTDSYFPAQPPKKIIFHQIGLAAVIALINVGVPAGILAVKGADLAAMPKAYAPNLLTPYAATKFEGEIQMDLYDRIFNLPTISVTFFLVYGPRQPTTGAYAIVTGVFLKTWMDDESLPIEGDGSHYRNLIHARDIAKALILAQQSPHRGIVVNAGTGVHVAERKNDLVGTLADMCKTKKMLGFEARIHAVMGALIEDAADPYAQSRHDLATLAEMLARDKQITVIPYRIAYHPLLENLVYSLVNYLAKNLPCFNATAYSPPSFSNVEEHAGEGDGWALISWIKPRITHALLQLGYTVHLSDMNIADLRNVWATFLPWLDAAGADLAIKYEPPWPVNTGNNVARPTRTPFDIFREYLAIGDRDQTIPDQRSFGTTLAAHGGLCQSREACADLQRQGKLAVRDFRRFSGVRRPARATRSSVPYLHPICMAGQEIKKRTMIGPKVWLMREVCPAADAGEEKDPEVRESKCLGVPASLMSGPSALNEPAFQVEDRDCLGQFTAE